MVLDPGQAKILFIVIVSLFIITFLFTLLSLPGWIKIEEKYKKPLFYGFIIELGLAFFAYFEMIKKPTYVTEPAMTEWVAYSLKDKELFQPTLHLEGNIEDTVAVLGKNIEDDDLLDKNLFVDLTKDDGIRIKTQNDQVLGKIPTNKFGFFNSVHPTNTSGYVDNMKTIKYVSTDNKTWQRSVFQYFNKDKLGFDIIVKDTSIGTKYKIVQRFADGKVKHLFDSMDNQATINALNVKDRIIHAFEHDDAFYLIYITSADNKGLDTLGNIRERHFQFEQLEFRPGLVYKD